MPSHIAFPTPTDRAVRATLRLVNRIAAQLAEFHTRLNRRRRIRATRRVLESLDDRTLDDIGIDRSEIHSVAATSWVGDRYRDTAHI